MTKQTDRPWDGTASHARVLNAEQSKTATKATAFTPGPWTANDMHDNGKPELWVYDTRADQLIARVICETKTQEANAKLIAAAPDMAEALREIAEFSDSPFAKRLASDALAKAGL